MKEIKVMNPIIIVEEVISSPQYRYETIVAQQALRKEELVKKAKRLPLRQYSHIFMWENLRGEEVENDAVGAHGINSYNKEACTACSVQMLHKFFKRVKARSKNRRSWENEAFGKEVFAELRKLLSRMARTWSYHAWRSHISSMEIEDFKELMELCFGNEATSLIAEAEQILRQRRALTEEEQERLLLLAKRGEELKPLKSSRNYELWMEKLRFDKWLDSHDNFYI